MGVGADAGNREEADAKREKKGRRNDAKEDEIKTSALFSITTDDLRIGDVGEGDHRILWKEGIAKTERVAEDGIAGDKLFDR